jgi:hypothetical protein
MKFIHQTAVLMLGLLTLASCKKETEISNTETVPLPVFFAKGTVGTQPLNLTAGYDKVSIAPVTVQDERLYVNGANTLADESLFVTGCRFKVPLGPTPGWQLTLLFALASADSLQVKTYNIASFSPITPNSTVYSSGRAAVKISSMTTASNNYSSYAEHNAGNNGTVTITSIENYTEAGKKYKKAGFDLNVKVYRMQTLGFDAANTQQVTLSGVALF